MLKERAWAADALPVLQVRASLQDLSTMANSFVVTQLRIEGATCRQRTFELAEVPFTTHGVTILRWVLNEAAAGAADEMKTVNVPLYLDTTRANLITVVPFEPAAGTAPTVFYRRGVAMMCSSLSGIVA